MPLKVPPLSPVICRPHAAPTERFRAFMAREAVVDRPCPGRRENLIKRLREEQYPLRLYILGIGPEQQTLAK